MRIGMCLWLVLMLTRCSSSIGLPEVPADFNVEYDWSEGSLPPPYHYQYTIIINANGEAAINYSPDYPGKDTPTWNKTWKLTPEHIQSLYTNIVSHNVFTTNWMQPDNHPVGGSHERMTVQANTQRYTIPAYAEPAGNLPNLYAFIHDLVPQSIWDELGTARNAYIESFEQ